MYTMQRLRVSRPESVLRLLYEVLKNNKLIMLTFTEKINDFNNNYYHMTIINIVA